MEDWLYTHQQGMTPETVRQAARDVGQVPDFDARYKPTLEFVKGDIALGEQLKVSQTPTFFINGIKIDGAWAPQFFDQAIAYELAHAK
jgi:protein-disulfide isomerase